MSLASRSSSFAVGLVTAWALVVGCGSDGGGTTGGGGGTLPADSGTGADGGGTGTGLPPGSKCVVDVDAGKMVSTSCLDNPLLPTCFQCVDVSENGALDGVCAYTCRMGKEDCPQGQTCTAANTTQRTGYQPCRDATNGFELGYCR